jgi:hypothetical protein
MLRIFRWPGIITVVGLVAALGLGGPSALFTVAILAVLEVSLSFDNAVVNAKVLGRLSPQWQRIFLTLGIGIAVFGMRLLFPLAIVGVTAKLNPYAVLDLAINHGDQYGLRLHEAHPMIAAFGGIFLLLLFLDWAFETRGNQWISWLERPLARIGKMDQLSVVIALLALVFVATFLAEDGMSVMISGVLGGVTYLTINGLGTLFESSSKATGAGGTLVGKAAFFLFFYLEILDASFSFDGVIGAFAISSNLFVIATGLGIGAMYIRSLTVYFVKKRTLDAYLYLEHGANWAIGALALIMLVGVGRHQSPELITGLVGAGLIVGALISSYVHNQRNNPDLQHTEDKEMNEEESSQ